MATLCEDETIMAKMPKTSPVRLTDEALKWVRIASGYTGESAAEYASRVLLERAKADADELHAKVKGEEGPKKPKR